jgi:hypothetical protein
MKRRVFIKIILEDGLNALESHRKLVERYGRESLKYAVITYWRSEFHTDRQNVEDNPRPGRRRDFEIILHLEQTSAAFPNRSVRSIAEITEHELSTVFSILTQVLHLKFRPWLWVDTHSPTLNK